MANSGNFNTSAYKTTSSRTHYLIFSWQTVSSNIEANTTSIEWTIKGYATDGYVMAQNITLNIEGNTVFKHLLDQDGQIELRNGTVVATGTYKFTHAANGSKSFTAYLEAGLVNWSPNVSGSQTFALDTIPRGATLTYAPNFNDEQNPTINYTNPAGNAVNSLQVCITLDGTNADIAYRDISKTGSAYTFALNDDERNLLRNATLSGSNTRTVKFYLKTVIGESVFYSRSAEKTFTVINANPVLAPVAVDTSSNAIALTGNSSTIIKGYNSVKVTANATAKKGATIQSYLITNKDKAIAASSGYFDYTESGTFTFKATDSRGLSTTQTVTLKVIDYFPVTCSLKPVIEVTGETQAKITLNISGNYFSGSFGSKSNSLTVKYRYKTYGGSYGEWVTVSGASVANGRYSVSAAISGLDYKTSYVVQAIAYDAVYYGGVASAEITVKATPVFDWSGEDFNFNVPVSINGVELDYIVEQGTKNGWDYRKWKSGKAECWKILEFSTTINTAFGSLYCGNATARQNYPFTFANKPVEVVTLQSGTTQAILYPEASGHGVNGASASARYNVFRPGALTTSQTFYLSFYVYGQY